MRRITNPSDWVIDRFKSGKSVFATRLNDGDHISMYKTRPEGSLLGTYENPAYTHYELGDHFWRMLLEMSASSQDIKDSIMIGCSCGTERADHLAEMFEKDVEKFQLEDLTWANEHWALDGVVDGSTIRLLDYLRGCKRTALATCEKLALAIKCTYSQLIVVKSEDSWTDRERVYEACKLLAEKGCIFLWCAGTGLKPTAWRLYKEFPQSSHIDLGHLFNGAMGLKDYSWLETQSGPWYQKYMEEFVPYVRSFIK